MCLDVRADIRQTTQLFFAILSLIIAADHCIGFEHPQFLVVWIQFLIATQVNHIQVRQQLYIHSLTQRLVAQALGLTQGTCYVICYKAL